MKVNNNEKLKESILISIFVLSFFPPIFKDTLVQCYEISSSFNNFLYNYTFYFKIILALFLITKLKYIKENIVNFNFFFIYSFVLLISVIVSNDIKSSLIIFLNFILFISFLIIFYIRFNENYFIKLIFYYLLIIAVFSIVLINFKSYSYCLNSASIKIFSGLTFHKNQLGLYIFAINYIYLFFIDSYKTNKKYLLLFTISILYLFVIDSITALFLLILAYGYKFLINYKFLLFFPISFILFLNYDYILNLFNRDITLSGRTKIWANFDLSNISIFGNGLGFYRYNLNLIDNSIFILLLDTGLIFTIFYFLWLIKNFFINKENYRLIFLVAIIYSIVENISVLYSNNILALLIILSFLFNTNVKNNYNNLKNV